MSEITSGPSLDAQIYAMKKAIDVQEQGTLKVLESANLQSAEKSSGASVTGVGQKLDVKG
jgi:hypothetical protein